MPRNLKRHYGTGDLHFILARGREAVDTFSRYERRPLLGTVRARKLFVKVMGEVRERYGFLLVGYVWMPEHVHLLMSEPKKGTASKAIQALKQRVSGAMRGKKRRGLHGKLSLKLPNAVGGLRRFWRERFYDFNVWSSEKRKEKLNYMHANPVLRGLAEHPGSQGLYLQTLSYRRTGRGAVGRIMRREKMDRRESIRWIRDWSGQKRKRKAHPFRKQKRKAGAPPEEKTKSKSSPGD